MVADAVVGGGSVVGGTVGSGSAVVVAGSAVVGGGSGGSAASGDSPPPHPAATKTRTIPARAHNPKAATGGAGDKDCACFDRLRNRVIIRPLSHDGGHGPRIPT